MLQKVPRCFLGLGVQGKEWGKPYHVDIPTFRIDESALAIGTALLVAVTLEWTQQNS